MKKIYAILLVVLTMTGVVYAQGDSVNMAYRRSSLYSIMISHPGLKMDREIVNAFMQIETPDKYNDHDLSIKCLTTQSRKDAARSEVEEFFIRNDVAKRMVSKWFLRDKESGGFSPDLVLERGLYDATASDIEEAKHKKRGVHTIADKGYDLIDNSFVIVNDITYVDHEANANTAIEVLSFIGALASAATGQEENLVTSLTDLGSVISSMIAGFTVKITSHLYQLQWDEKVAGDFYDNYYYDIPADDSLSYAAFLEDGTLAEKREMYEQDHTTFSLKYIGSYKAKSAKPVLRGLYSPTDVFRKVLARAIDNNVVELAKKYDQFKVKIPLYGVDPVVAKIGMKEGVTPKSRYEVLMPEINEETGEVKYRRKGVISPVPGKIWDNRYMATEEDAEGSELNVTTFKVVSGGNFTAGMLIREIK